MLPSPRAVIFDFDYTLADSSEGVVACVDHALAGLGLAAEPPERIRETIGLSLPATLVALKGPTLTDRGEEFRRLFVECADEVMVDRTVLYPWVPQTVASLAAGGIALGIASTKYRRRIEATLLRDGLRGHFRVVIGGEDVAKPKPAPDALLLAIEMLRRRADEVLFVGDSSADGLAALAAHVPFLAVLSGVTPREHLERLAPVAVLDSARDLPAFLGAG